MIIIGNHGQSAKTELKYELAVFAYVKKYPRSVYNMRLTGDKNLLEDLKIGIGNSDKFVKRLLEVAVIHTSDDRFVRPQKDNPEIKPKTREYCIIEDQYFDRIRDLLPHFFDIDEKIRTNKYLVELNQYIRDLVEDFRRNTPLTEPRRRGRPKVITDEQLLTNCNMQKRIIAYMSNVMFCVDNYKVVECFTEDCEYKVDLLEAFEKSQKAVLDYYRDPSLYSKGVQKVAKLMLNRPTDSMLSKTSFSLLRSKDDCNSFRRYYQLNDDEKVFVAQIFLSRILERNEFLFLKTLVEFNRDHSVFQRMGISVRIRQYKKCVYVSFAGRYCTPYCAMREDKRRAINLIEGYNVEFDLHSAVFATVGMLNKQIKAWTCDWDLKTLIKEKHFTDAAGKELSKGENKTLAFRVMFSASDKQGYSWLRYSYMNAEYSLYNYYDNSKKVRPPDVTEETFNAISKVCHENCGEIRKNRSMAFINESIFECYLIARFICEGIRSRSVYDCFYFSSKDGVDVELIKELINKFAREFCWFSWSGFNNQNLASSLCAHCAKNCIAA